MSSLDVDLVLVDARSHIGSGSRGANLGLIVLEVVGFIANALPLEFSDIEDPRVVESAFGIVVTTEHENVFSLVEGDCHVLGTRQWIVSALDLYFGPEAVVWCELHKVDVTVWPDLTGRGTVLGVCSKRLFDTAIKHIILLSNPGESMARSSARLISLLV